VKLSTHCFFLLLLFVFAGCSKPGQPNNPTVNKEKLLTQKPWRLFSYGLDVNNNGLTDPSEEAINNCEKDNTYSFALDGSGIVSDNIERCPGNNAMSSFEWSFVNNETELDFIHGFAVLLKLTGDSMMLGEKSTGHPKLIFNYKH
jgi:hypothetical protein